MRSFRFGAFLALALLALAAPGAQAQRYESIALGAAKPVRDDFGKDYATGYTGRGQLGYSMSFADVHLQVGYTRFPVEEDVTDREDLSVLHAGVGVRIALGAFWVGGNAAYFFGGGEEGVGYVPEVGLKIWRFEAVADLRVDGDEKWGAARLGFRF
jgi:hypothetical protein